MGFDSILSSRGLLGQAPSRTTVADRFEPGVSRAVVAEQDVVGACAVEVPDANNPIAGV